MSNFAESSLTVAQRETIRKMRTEGYSFSLIAGAVGCPLHAVEFFVSYYKIESPLGTVHRKAREHERSFTAKQIARMIELREQGLKFQDIADALGKTLPSLKHAWLRYHKRPYALRHCAPRHDRKPIHSAKPKTQRRCLNCRTVFPSTGAGNRICKDCSQSHAWYEGQEPSFSIRGVRA